MPFLRAEAIEMLTGPYKLYVVSLSYLIIHFGIGFAQQSPLINLSNSITYSSMITMGECYN
jgi:hypothetical protein